MKKIAELETYFKRSIKKMDSNFYINFNPFMTLLSINYAVISYHV